MALGATHTTHAKRASFYAKVQRSHAQKMTNAAKKGQCKVALTQFANVAFAAGAAFSEGRGSVKRHRRVEHSAKQLNASRRVKGFRASLAKLAAACHK